ncbi:MAG: porphobilinogen synthase [Deltaproteobacteria bacterium]|jgi:porphobilinogen synthase|nr:porphobilinogen synthase [Deltaproteobacteria bacterium]MBT6432900.1 porphobilinogen synthase [Deltaproteobacteria bacterium]MBT6492106.1 porphobilinogen synthase [Deltaproteobacteria bacterium]
MSWTPHGASFPHLRHRRKRQNAWVRDMVREHRLCPADFILPVFVHEAEGKHPIGSMPGVHRHDLAGIVEVAKEAASFGIPGLAIFPVVPSERKTENASEAWRKDNLMCQTVREIKDAGVEIGLICDVALDPYTSHGQDGIVENGVVMNDITLDALCKQALAQAEAGCDVIAPSDMMDGRIAAIRATLDLAGYDDVLILSYAAKYASAFYGPFRDAVGSKGNLGTGDKRTYQMDPANTDEALREVASDLDEGADMVMVKPGLPYLDIIRRVKETFKVPTAAYHVSGEYAMIHAAAQNGWLDLEGAMMESLLSFKRAGADAILTYAALDACKWLSK